jgi:hypothetical protein
MIKLWPLYHLFQLELVLVEIDSFRSRVGSFADHEKYEGHEKPTLFLLIQMKLGSMPHHTN